MCEYLVVGATAHVGSLLAHVDGDSRLAGGVQLLELVGRLLVNVTAAVVSHLGA